MVKATTLTYLKWAIVLFVVYQIWKCVKQDREHFQSTDKTSTIKYAVKEGMCGTGKHGSGPDISSGKTCSGDPKRPGTCNTNGGAELLPILSPLFNLREISKCCILTEDHLANEQKRCYDCIIKHLQHAEALSEEAITLDTKGEYHIEKLKLAEAFRDITRQFLDEKDPQSLAQQLRLIRKPLMNQYRDQF